MSLRDNPYCEVTQGEYIVDSTFGGESVTDDTKNLMSAGQADGFTRLFAGTVQNSRHMSRLDKVSASMQSLEFSLMRREDGKTPPLTKAAAE